MSEMPPGSLARVFAFEHLGKSQIENLQAFGLSPGQWVRVLQQAPETVIEVGNIELAIEEELARKIRMDHTSTQSELASS
jgi:Fe2+ transport system protein FeoA